jgi:hypothetical protein
MALSGCLAGCQPPVPGYTPGSMTLAELHRSHPGLAEGYGQAHTALVLFDCSQTELLALHTSNAQISRIGDGSTAQTRIPRSVPDSEDGALLGRLLDCGSYSRSSFCAFEPALSITCQTSKGIYSFSVCFACSDISISLPSGKSRMVHMSSELRRTLLRLARGIYPDDPVLGPLYRSSRV